MTVPRVSCGGGVTSGQGAGPTTQAAGPQSIRQESLTHFCFDLVDFCGIYFTSYKYVMY